jgi:endonuclease-3
MRKGLLGRLARSQYGGTGKEYNEIGLRNEREEFCGIMTKFPFNEMINTLKTYLKDEVPVVTRISKSETGSPFLVLVSTLLSLRTKDETTDQAMERLVKVATTPEELLNLSDQSLEKIIYPVGFYRNKAKTLKTVSSIIIQKYHGKVPDSLDELLTIKGVGRKTANLVVTEAYGKPGICVDTHVHRISNRLGILSTKNPHQTEEELRRVLPRKYWKIYNTLLVAFGRRTCQPVSPRCTQCPIAHLCGRIGVTRYR